ncbi:hypothetical protein DPMN_048352 [Dreissena polymorpha]|uniref:Uncharacterized protein n=1 Tax=Dreissena polymorpha TaxID=45954 RepID=A0A9D4DBG4_DREPO|nr:hypothetical protein DPMN_048352 [Dreissena polymorpha]
MILTSSVQSFKNRTKLDLAIARVPVPHHQHQTYGREPTKTPSRKPADNVTRKALDCREKEKWDGPSKRSERRRNDVDAAEESGPEQSALAWSCCGPMLYWELTGIS